MRLHFFNSAVITNSIEIGLLIDHMTINGLHLELLSAYNKHYSTESALLKVKNHILLNMDAQKVTLLVLLGSQRSFRYCTPRHLAGSVEVKTWCD